MTTEIREIPIETIEGKGTSLAAYADRVLLVVNVASKCGLTPQYEALEKVYEQYRERGLVVLGFPANDFGAQEPGSNEEIAEFCTSRFNVAFPMFSKISVKGSEQHPLYRALVAAKPEKTFKGGGFKQKLASYGIVPEREDDVLWNFEKFLIGRDGRVVARFAPDIAPDDALITQAIEAELAK